MVASRDHSNVCDERKILINEPSISILTIKLQSGTQMISSSSDWKLSGEPNYKDKTWQSSVTRCGGMEGK